MIAYIQMEAEKNILGYILSNFDARYGSIVAKCRRTYQGGCLNWQEDRLQLKEHIGIFTIGDCYDLCYKRTSCYGFFLNERRDNCQLFKQGCQRKIESPPDWEYYEMEDCQGIFLILETRAFGSV